MREEQSAKTGRALQPDFPEILPGGKGCENRGAWHRTVSGTADHHPAGRVHQSKIKRGIRNRI